LHGLGQLPGIHARLRHGALRPVDHAGPG
jgi:hypothetical protein